MIRLDNTQPVTQDVKTDVAGLLRMKLHTRYVAALDRGAKSHAVFGDRGGVVSDRRGIGVCEIDLRSVLDAGHQTCRPRERDGIPANMRNFQPAAYALRKIEAGSF